MKKLLLLFFICLNIICTACGENTAIEITKQEELQTIEILIEQEEVIENVCEIESEILQMSLEEKIGQLFMLAFRSDISGDVTKITENMTKYISQYNIGGVILFAENLDTTEQTQKLINDMQTQAKTPLFIAVDEEGGIVSRLASSKIEHEKFPSVSKITTENDASYMANKIGETLINLGINVNFAPVADVNTNLKNPVIGNRAFSSDEEIASNMVAIFIENMEKTGVSATAKHFPGHGDTKTDSHYGTAVVNHDLQRLSEIEFLPFKSAIEKEVDFIMMGHISTPNITQNYIPASINSEIVNILRQELEFDGIIITDAMNMQAITDEYGSEDSAIMAINAGIDIILMPEDFEKSFNAILAGVKSGEILEETINDSIYRILKLKHEKNVNND